MDGKIAKRLERLPPRPDVCQLDRWSWCLVEPTHWWARGVPCPERIRDLLVGTATGKGEERLRKGTGVGANGAEGWKTAAQDQGPVGGEAAECSLKDC